MSMLKITLDITKDQAQELMRDLDSVQNPYTVTTFVASLIALNLDSSR